MRTLAPRAHALPSNVPFSTRAAALSHSLLLRAHLPLHPVTHTHRSERIGAEIEQKEKDQMSTRQMIMQVQQAAQAAKAAGGGGATGGASYASAAAGSES